MIISEKQEVDAQETWHFAIELMPKDLKDKDMKKNWQVQENAEDIEGDDAETIPVRLIGGCRNLSGFPFLNLLEIF